MCYGTEKKKSNMYLGNSQWFGVAGMECGYGMCLEDSETSELGWASFEENPESRRLDWIL